MVFSAEKVVRWAVEKASSIEEGTSVSARA
jgi:hypothetical protein